VWGSSWADPICPFTPAQALSVLQGYEGAVLAAPLFSVFAATPSNIFLTFLFVR